MISTYLFVDRKYTVSNNVLHSQPTARPSGSHAARLRGVLCQMTTDSVTPQEAREELYDCIRGEGSFESKARAALKVGTRFLDADSGYLARVDTETEHWELLVSAESVDGEPLTDQGLDFEMSYCRRTVGADAGQIALHDATAQGWADDPAFQEQGFHCYHGTTLIVDGEPYGTVCFVAEGPREEFSDCECLFAELIARLLERELERQQHETELTRQANLATVLNRVLRHNLRNKLSVIRGYTQLLADSVDDAAAAPTDDATAAPTDAATAAPTDDATAVSANPAADSAVGETALDTIDSLIELSEKARKLDHIIGADTDPETADLSALAESVAGTVACQYPAATIQIDAEESVTGQVLPSIERALTELVENAAKHGGEAPSVRIAVEAAGNDIEIRIADDGPGIAAHEVSVLENGAESPLTHGSGLGLWLAHWIVSSHGGSIEATVSDAGTTMTVRLQETLDQPTTDGAADLTRTADQYQAVFEESSDAMVIVDTEGRIIEANPAAIDVYGIESQQLLGRSIAEFLPEEFDFEAAWRRFQTRDSKHDTVTIVGGDGVERRVEYTGTTDIIPGHHLIVSRELSKRSVEERRVS